MRQVLDILGALERAQPEPNGVDADPALAWLDDRHDELMEAFGRVVDLGDAEAALRFAAGLRVYLVDRGHVDVHLGSDRRRRWPLSPPSTCSPT